jgi:hypothetical protein
MADTTAIASQVLQPAVIRLKADPTGVFWNRFRLAFRPQSLWEPALATRLRAFTFVR